VRTGWLISLSLSANAAFVELGHHVPVGEEPEVAAGLLGVGVLGDLGRDLGELLAADRDALADGLDARQRRGDDGRLGLRRHLDHLEVHLGRHARELVPVILEVRLRLGLGHRVLGELLLAQAVGGHLLAQVGAVLVAQLRLGEVLALELLLEPRLAAEPLARGGDLAVHGLAHLGVRDHDALALRFALAQLLVDHLVEHLAAERVELGGVGQGRAVLLHLAQHEHHLLFDVADQHGLVVDHGGHGVERLAARGGLRGGARRARRGGVRGAGRRGGRVRDGLARGGGVCDDGERDGGGEHERRGGRASDELQAEPP
jgi:hypothetical protein